MHFSGSADMLMVRTFVCPWFLCETAVSTLVVVVVIVVVVVGTLVILDVLIVVDGAILDVFVSLDVARVVNCTVLPSVLIVATAAFRRSDEAATPTAQRRRQRGWITRFPTQLLILIVVRVVNCIRFPHILVVATAPFRRGSEAATPTEQR